MSNSPDPVQEVLGRHPSKFYAVVGRIVCTSAVVEQQMVTLRQAMEETQQGAHAQQSLVQQLRRARALLVKLPDQSAKLVDVHLDRVDLAFRRRNDVVHSCFPAQPDGRIYGHRLSTNKTVADGTAIIVEYSLAELENLGTEFARLAVEFNGIHNLVSHQMNF